MKYHICAILLILTLESVCAEQRDRFFISAPTVFHVDVKEKVFVQLGGSHLNTPVTLYLEAEPSGVVMSQKKETTCANEGETKIIELMIDKEMWSRTNFKNRNPYLMLVAESPTFNKRVLTRVSVSTRRGYIFIQTNQPIYNPAKTVKYRIFTLDHTLRPQNAVVVISIFNVAGNRVKNLLMAVKGGIFSDIINIPDVSEMGTWKITAHYEEDQAHAASREFQVQKFVLPSFGVTINMEQDYILLNAEQVHFSILAIYSYGERVFGAYHCRFGVLRKTVGRKTKPVFIKGIELTGLVTEGNAGFTLQIAQLTDQLQKQLNTTLFDLQQSGARLYLGVAVTNKQSGEVQRSEVSLPIISNKYTIDLTRSRSHFIPGAPLDVAVVIRLPDGSPAVGVPVEISVSGAPESSTFETNQQGAVAAVFNIPNTNAVTVLASVDNQQGRKQLQRASSPSNSYLYLNINHKTYAVGNSPTITYNRINGPQSGFTYYMVLSRGIIVKNGVFSPDTKELKLDITADMVPSFRLIGYYYSQSGDIIADSVWIDVEDQCEIKVKVTGGQYEPGRRVNLKIDLHGQRAKVALLAVDKAIYALNVHNKLTAKQVFSSMESYDLGCSYGGGSDSVSTINDAGLSFMSHHMSAWRKGLCATLRSRNRRSVDIEQEMMNLQSNFSSEQLQDCCVRGFSLLPMRRTCQERAKRVSLWKEDPLCAEAFLKCCLKAETLRQKKAHEDARKGLGRAATTADIEEYFMLIADNYVRRNFPPSFEFKVYDINDETNSVTLTLPDSVTTWEIQAVTLSPTTGFCVADPSTIVAFQEVFVSLRLPYSVRKHEQISISPVIYNYGASSRQLAVHMEQTEGLCSPGSATSSSFVNITLEPMSSQLVSFTAVPMVTGSIPIKIRLYDTENEMGKDAVEKILNVQTEGMEHRTEKSYVLKLDGTNSHDIILDGKLPDGTVPDSSSNIFISVEGEGFNKQHLTSLLSPEGVHSLIRLPTGCLEQTMSKLVPTVHALRYLDDSQQWYELPAGARDEALQHIEHGYVRILGSKSSKDASYGSWTSTSASVWMTAYVVKVMSLVAERQSVSFGQQGRRISVAVQKQQISKPVEFLLSSQTSAGIFRDPNPVYHRGMEDREKKAFTTAFTALALRLSLPFIEKEAKTQAAITKAATYLRSQFEELQNPYVVAITAYCLSVCLPKGTDVSFIWTKLSAVATIAGDQCSVGANTGERQSEAAIKVETVAYALLTAMVLGPSEWADNAACWLISQKNYRGGFRSTQDTVMALEALAAYELGRSTSTFSNVTAEITVQGKRGVVKLSLKDKREGVETDLKRFMGDRISVHLTGKGNATLKIMKAYHLMGPKGQCEDVSISVTVEGTVSYTAKILEEYDYYDDEYNNEGKVDRVVRSAAEWSDAHTRDRRATDDNVNPEKPFTYTICVRANTNLSGMAIADITLLSGMEPLPEDLDVLKSKPEQYISHYELTKGRLILYFNQLFGAEECISFTAKQVHPIGLLQPAPAVFYDYYEPDIKCTVFYSAPRRSKMVSKLCMGDVCQCAEKPCHKVKDIFTPDQDQRIKLNARQSHACFFPVVDYAYIVEVVDVSTKSSFEMYTANVTDVLKSHGDQLVSDTSARMFAKRLQCKGTLLKNERYLIMGKDGATTDTNGAMQYLLESNTWVEKEPDMGQCRASRHRHDCKQYRDFVSVFKLEGCKQ